MKSGAREYSRREERSDEPAMRGFEFGHNLQATRTKGTRDSRPHDENKRVILVWEVAR